jgi:hypothetical protein
LPATQGEALRFAILRNGSEVGVHELRRETVAGMTRVDVTSRIDVRLLGLDLYRFRYRAQELWDQSGLLRLNVEVDDNGEAFRLGGERDAGRFRWTSETGSGEHPMPVFPTNHWNPEVLEQDAVLNTLTGRISRVEIVPEGRQLLDLRSVEAPALRYRYRGDLQLESWYDPRGQWLGVRFEGRDGSTIEYLCSNCYDGVSM